MLIATSPVALQKLIDVCMDYFTTHNLLINLEKTRCMTMFPASLKNLNVPGFFVNGSSLTTVTQKCYLGYIITNTDEDDFAIQKERRAVYSRGNMLFRKFKNCSIDVKKQLFTSYCSSFYCCSLWSNYKNATLKALHVAHNNIFRLLFHLPRRCSVSAYFVEYRLPNFSVIRKKLIYSLYRRVLDSCNSLISTIVNCNHFVSSRIIQEWSNVLF